MVENKKTGKEEIIQSAGCRIYKNVKKLFEKNGETLKEPKEYEIERLGRAGEERPRQKQFLDDVLKVVKGKPWENNGAIADLKFNFGVDAVAAVERKI